uniref:SNF2 N-terminal domain-containing protein n=1 Tax=Amphimedon queenslandica TaxID=400682 RepID=A0A1X7TFN6_AMPQE
MLAEKLEKPQKQIELTAIQKQYYRAILERNFTFLTKGSNTVPNLLNTMMELRKCSKDNLVMDEPRVRRQVRCYGDEMLETIVDMDESQEEILDILPLRGKKG